MSISIMDWIFGSMLAEAIIDDRLPAQKTDIRQPEVGEDGCDMTFSGIKFCEYDAATPSDDLEGTEYDKGQWREKVVGMPWV